MPQLDVATFPSQLFWLAICFCALYALCSFLAIPRIARVLDVRQATLEEKLNKASTYREEAETLLADYEAALARARVESQARSQAAARARSSELAHRQKDFLDKRNDRLHLAEQDLYRARLDAGADTKVLAVEMAQLILEKLTGRAYSAQELEG
jgi:F-type H+-transporting ATPase subunit b